VEEASVWSGVEEVETPVPEELPQRL